MNELRFLELTKRKKGLLEDYEDILDLDDPFGDEFILDEIAKQIDIINSELKKITEEET